MGGTRILLAGGRVVDPSTGRDGVMDVLIQDGRVFEIGTVLTTGGHTTVVQVPDGCVICPGFIDMHVHLREPGAEHKETVATGSRPRWRGALPPWRVCPRPTPPMMTLGLLG